VIDELAKQRAIKRLKDAHKAQQVTDKELMEAMAELERRGETNRGKKKGNR
jgi:hypothetical protein